MSQTEDVARLIAARGHGTYEPQATTSTIFCGELPPAPVAAIAITPYPGEASDSKLGVDAPRYQFTIRDTTYSAAETRAAALYSDLVGLSRQQLGDAWLNLITPVQSGPIWMPPEAGGSQRFVVNLALNLRRPTVHRV